MAIVLQNQNEEDITVINKKTRSAIHWLFGTNSVSQLISWAITILVARILSPGDYGLFGMAGLLTSFLVLFNELGLGPAIIQKKDLSREQLNSVFWVIIGINIFLYLLAFISAPLVSSFFNEKRLTSIIRIAAIALVIGGLYKVPYSLLTKELVFNKRCTADFIARFFGTFSTLLFAFLGYGVWSLVYGLLIIEFVKLICIFIFTGWFPERNFSYKSIKGMVNFGYKIAGSGILWFFYSNSDYLIAGKFLGKTLLGYYSLAFQLASLPLEKITSIIGQIIFPYFSKIQDDEVALRNSLLKIIRLVAFVTFPILMGMFLVADSAIPLILSEKWITSILPFKVLCLISMLRVIAPIDSRLVVAKGRSDISFTNMLICSLIMPLGFLIGSRYGIKGLCCAWLFLYPLVFLIMIKRSIRIINLSLLEYFKNLISPIIATFFMVVTVHLFKFLLSGYPNNLLRFVSYSSIGVLSYFGFIAVFLKKYLLEAKAFIWRS